MPRKIVFFLILLLTLGKRFKSYASSLQQEGESVETIGCMRERRSSPPEDCTVTAEGSDDLLFDLSSLWRRSNQNNHKVASGNHTFFLNICGSLSPGGASSACNAKLNNAAVCELSDDGENAIHLGVPTSPKLKNPVDPAAGVVLDYLAQINHNGSCSGANGRSSSIIFTCGSETGTPTLTSVQDCMYIFAWETNLVCFEPSTVVSSVSSKTTYGKTTFDSHTNSTQLSSTSAVSDLAVRSCQVSQTSRGIWPNTSEGGVHTLPCSPSSDAFIYRICCTEDVHLLTRIGSGICKSHLYGQWLNEDTRECVSETTESLRRFADGLTGETRTIKVEEVVFLSETLVAVLTNATAALKDVLAGLDDIDEDNIETVADRERNQRLVLAGVRASLVVVSRILSSNFTLDSASIHRILNSLNRLGFTPGVNILSVNMTQIEREFDGLDLTVTKSSPFGYKNALLGLVNSIANRNKQRFNSTTPEAGIDISTYIWSTDSDFAISSDTRAGRLFRAEFSQSNADHQTRDNQLDQYESMLAMAYLDNVPNGQRLTTLQPQVVSPIVDLTVVSESHSDFSTHISETNEIRKRAKLIDTPFKMTFDTSLPSSKMIFTLLSKYVEEVDFQEDVIPITVGVTFASEDETAIVLKIAFAVDSGGKQTLLKTQDALTFALWNRITAAVETICSDTMQGPLCYDPLDATIHIPYSPMCAWWNHEKSVWSDTGCELSQILLLTPHNSKIHSPENIYNSSVMQSQMFQSLNGSVASETGHALPFLTLEKSNVSSSVYVRASCVCTHMTTFAILVTNSPDSVARMPTREEDVLTIFTYAGIGTSVTCLLLTVLAYMRLWNKPFVQQHHKFVIHMCLPLILVQLLLLVVLHPHTKKNNYWCLVVSGALHFCLMALSGWMLCISRDIYGTFVTVFVGTRRGSSIAKFVGLVYGLSAAVLIVCMSVAHEAYRTAKVCWIDMTSHLRLAFLIPFGGTLLVNTVVLIFVLCSIKGRVQLKTTAFAGLTFMWILGFSWLFGIIAMFHQHIIWEYLFTIFTLSEGVFIFVHYCLRSSKVRDAFFLSKASKLARRQKEMHDAKQKDYSSSKVRTHSKDNMSFFEPIRPLRKQTVSSTIPSEQRRFSLQLPHFFPRVFGQLSRARISPEPSSLGESPLIDDSILRNTEKTLTPLQNDTRSSNFSVEDDAFSRHSSGLKWESAVITIAEDEHLQV